MVALAIDIIYALLVQRENGNLCVSYETETDNSSSEVAGRPTSASNATMDVIKTVGAVMYKIPLSVSCLLRNRNNTTQKGPRNSLARSRE